MEEPYSLAPWRGTFRLEEWPCLHILWLWCVWGTMNARPKFRKGIIYLSGDGAHILL